MNEDTYALTPPRNCTGAPGHDKLRAAWGVPAGGRGQRPDERKSDDVVANLAAATRKLNERRAAAPLEREDDARAAYADRLDGYSVRYVLTKYGFREHELRRHWKRMGLAAPGQVRSIVR